MNFKNNTLHTSYLFNGICLLLVSYSFLPRWTLFDFYLKFNNKLHMDKNKVFYLEKNLVNGKLRVKENERTPSITKGKCI